MAGRTSISLLLALGLAGSGIAWSQSGAPGAQPGVKGKAATPQLPPGYIARDQLPDSLALLPPPPAPGSAAFARDEEARTQAAQLTGTARWTLAVSDADLSFPHALEGFSCPAGAAIGPRGTPRLYRLLQKAAIDIGLSTYRAKTHYQRIRPFVMHNARSCTPAEEDFLRHDGSYPSGHSALGWGWALLLTELAPARADAILQRGRDFGESRIVCNVHWRSDVDAGRVISAAAVARLHGEPQFRADLEAARTELASAPAPSGCNAASLSGNR